MRLLLTLTALALAGAAHAYDPPPPPVVASYTPDPPPVVTRTEFEDLKTQVAELKARLGSTTATVKNSGVSCGCPLAGGKCPTTGFCGGEGCACTQAKLQTVPPLAPVVAAPAPFTLESPCGPEGCPTTPTTGVTAAAATSTAFPASYGTGLTYTLAPGAAIRGGTSGCAGGACAAPTFRPARRLFGR